MFSVDLKILAVINYLIYGKSEEDSKYVRKLPKSN